METAGDRAVIREILHLREYQTQRAQLLENNKNLSLKLAEAEIDNSMLRNQLKEKELRVNKLRAAVKQRNGLQGTHFRVCSAQQEETPGPQKELHTNREEIRGKFTELAVVSSSVEDLKRQIEQVNSRANQLTIEKAQITTEIVNELRVKTIAQINKEPHKGHRRQVSKKKTS